MGYALYSSPKPYLLFDGTSASSSNYTSGAALVAEYGQLSLSWNTTQAVASNLTVWASNEDGFAASIVTWSAVTTLVGQGVFAVEAGMRWLRVARSSLDSQSLSFLQVRT